MGGVVGQRLVLSDGGGGGVFLRPPLATLLPARSQMMIGVCGAELAPLDSSSLQTRWPHPFIHSTSGSSEGRRVDSAST